MSTAVATANNSAIKEKRSVGMGIFFIVVAIAIVLFFGVNSTSEMTTTFGEYRKLILEKDRLKRELSDLTITLKAANTALDLIARQKAVKAYKSNM